MGNSYNDGKSRRMFLAVDEKFIIFSLWKFYAKMILFTENNVKIVETLRTDESIHVYRKLVPRLSLDAKIIFVFGYTIYRNT